MHKICCQECLNVLIFQIWRCDYFMKNRTCKYEYTRDLLWYHYSKLPLCGLYNQRISRRESKERFLNVALFVLKIVVGTKNHRIYAISSRNQKRQGDEFDPAADKRDATLIQPFRPLASGNINNYTDTC